MAVRSDQTASWAVAAVPADPLVLYTFAYLIYNIIQAVQCLLPSMDFLKLPAPVPAKLPDPGSILRSVENHLDLSFSETRPGEIRGCEIQHAAAPFR